MHSFHRFAAATAAVTAAAGLTLLAVAPASAATYTVTTTADSGPGSFAQAIVDANASAGADVITFAPALAGATIAPASPTTHTITDALTITGPGSGVTFSNTQLYTPSAADLTVENIDFADINAGYAINHYGGALTVTDVSISASGAAIDGIRVGTSTDGPVSITNVSVHGVSAQNGIAVTLTTGSAPTVEISDVTLTGSFTIKGINLQSYLGADIDLNGVSYAATDGTSQGVWIIAHGGTVTLDELDISGTVASALLVDLYVGADVTLQNSRFENNSASTGPVTILDRDGGADIAILSTIFANNVASSRAGALSISAGSTVTQVSGTSLEIADSTFRNNSAGDWGGATSISLDDFTAASITRTEFTGNTGGMAAVLFLETSPGLTVPMVFDSSTFSGNGPGNWINVVNNANMELRNVTMTGNSPFDDTFRTSSGTTTVESSTFVDNSGQVAARFGGMDALEIRNSIFWNPAVTSSEITYSGLSASVNYSLLGSTTGFGSALTNAMIAGSGNLVGVDPELGSLADNGGPTRTRAPLAGSPVIDAGDPAFTGPPATDQRGETRVLDGRIDIGAVEGLAPAAEEDGDESDGPDGELAATGVDSASATTAAGGAILLGIAALLAVGLRRRHGVGSLR